ncbi:MAG: DUF1343 domain-containing protein, partial [Defluviitaleaceae bacterium]|nr:DUF1343 domain-containing protein [Defluviitaleaceae bacterium]
MSIKLGIDRIDEYSDVFNDKRIGLVTNHSGVNSKFESTIDILKSRFNLIKLFAPEHGVRGSLQAGVAVDSYVDERTNLPVISLYGKSEKFTKEMLDDIDIVAVHLPDIGSRFWTYLYTMTYAMQACAAHGKTCVVFDGPNPINAMDVEGCMLNADYASFVGLYPIPFRHGLTMGECAKLFNEAYGIGGNLEIVKMSGYRRDMVFEDTGLSWILPSPNIPTPETAFAFCSTCIFEGTNVSEGRGTNKPFFFIGAPWINGEKLAYHMNTQRLPGVYFRNHYFTPASSKHKDDPCQGVEMHILDKKAFKPVQSGISLLYAIRDMHKEFEFLALYGEGETC